MAIWCSAKAANRSGLTQALAAAMDSLVLKILGCVYFLLGTLAAIALSRSSFRADAFSELVRFSRAAKLAWTVAFIASAGSFGLALLLGEQWAVWLGWVTAATYIGSTLHEVVVDYGRDTLRVLRPGFFFVAVTHIVVATLVTFVWLRLP